MLPVLPHRPWGRCRVPSRASIGGSCVHVSSTAINGKHLMESPATPHMERSLHTCACQQQPCGTHCPVPTTRPSCHVGQGTAGTPHAELRGPSCLPAISSKEHGENLHQTTTQGIEPPVPPGLSAAELEPCSPAKLHANVLMVTESSHNGEFN